MGLDIENGQKVEVIVGNSARIERRLRRIGRQLDRLFSVIDSYDDVSDQTVALKELTERVKNILPEDNA